MNLSSEYTFKNLIDFVLNNRGTKSFVNKPLEQIVIQLKEGLDAGTCLYATEEGKGIVGMILAEKQEKIKVLFIFENMSMNLKTLRQFAKIAKERFPTYKLEWLKHGRHKTHNTERIYQKLISL